MNTGRIENNWTDGHHAFPDSEKRINKPNASGYKKNHIEMTLTSACPMMCSYCPQSSFIRGYKSLKTGGEDMTLENYKAILSNVDVIGYVAFTGFTEPLRNKDWFDIVSHTINEGYRTIINTTLFKVSSEDIDKLVSLDIPISIHITDSKQEFPIKTYEEFIRKYKGEIRLNYFSRKGYDIAQKLNAPSHGGRVHDRGGNVPPDKAPKTPLIKGPVACTTKRQYSNVVVPNGDVSVCCSDFGLEHILGNLLTTKLSEIHKSLKMKNFNNKMKEGNEDFICNKCWYATPIKPK
tara:strand:- start:2176 stop:3051 length:876 start_codon:yes stop_codon:yes gene_type:complete